MSSTSGCTVKPSKEFTSRARAARPEDLLAGVGRSPTSSPALFALDYVASYLYSNRLHSLIPRPPQAYMSQLWTLKFFSPTVSRDMIAWGGLGTRLQYWFWHQTCDFDWKISCLLKTFQSCGVHLCISPADD